MLVRPATVSDCPTIAAIENAAIRDSFAHFGTTPVAEAQVITALEKARGRYPWVVAELDGEVLGFARAGAWKEREAYRWTCEVGVYVAERWQGRGVGRALYDVLFPELERLGLRTILAGIALPNEPSVRLHEAMGMTPIGVFPGNGFKFGEWRDVGYWGLWVGEGAPGFTIDD